MYLPLTLCMSLCVKGEDSKPPSEIGSCARSMEDVNGSKKDVSASAGEMTRCSKRKCKGLNTTFIYIPFHKDTACVSIIHPVVPRVAEGDFEFPACLQGVSKNIESS